MNGYNTADPYARGGKQPMRVRVIISYVADYLIIIILAAIFFALDKVTPFHQHFALQNYTLQYPYAEEERVPVWALGIIVVLAPAIIIAVYSLLIDGMFSHHKTGSFFGPHGMKDRLWELNCGILGLLLASGTAFVITSAMKNATGKPRPDFIDRCQPIAGSSDPIPYGLSDFSICTQTDDSIMKDAFRSFPSGHSSSSFGGLFFLSLYLAGKLHLYDQRGEVWKVFICLIPTLGAALIAISRIMDARHHPFDVLFGSLLGTVCAWVSYRQYFPSLSEPWKKGRAHPIRSWGTQPVPPSEAAIDREYGRLDQGKESLRMRGLPTTNTTGAEYDSLNDTEYVGSNLPRSQVAGQHQHQHQPQYQPYSVPIRDNSQVRTAYSATKGSHAHEEDTVAIEMDGYNKAGLRTRNSGDHTPFATTLQSIPQPR